MTRALLGASARELRQLVVERQVSCEEVVRTYIEHAERCYGEERWLDTIRGFTVRCRQGALDAARRADAEVARGAVAGLTGLPLTVKDNIDVAGLPTTLGLRARKGRLPSRDAAIVARARAQGAIVIGKSNVPQLLASGFECSNPLWGTTRNPWSLTHGPGGSSGGEAALIASGQSLLGLGTDLGGSIRSPAAFCGVVGVKPTTGAWPNQGLSPALPGQECVTAQVGPMARDVRDCELLFRALVAPTVRDAYAPPYDYVTSEDEGLSRMVVGYYLDDGFSPPAHASRRAVEFAARACEQAGATLVELPPTNQHLVMSTYVAALGADGGARLRRALAGEPLESFVRPLMWASFAPGWLGAAVAAALRAGGEPKLGALMGALGARSARQLWGLCLQRSELLEAELGAWESAKVDALLCPASATLALPLGQSRRLLATFGYTARYNLLGFPAGVLPVLLASRQDADRREVSDRSGRAARELERRAAGLPVAVQVVARPWREATLFRVMRAIEREVESSRALPSLPFEPALQTQAQPRAGF